MTAGPEFRPHGLIRHPQVQSILATKSPRKRLWRRRGSQMEQLAQPHVLEAGDGVRLSGWHSRQPVDRKPRGLAVLIHGWEGSHDSVYLYSMACQLFMAGYNIFRLNLRDHGASHHLNREPFHSARLREVIEAVRSAQALDGSEPLFVVGFSLGGNFTLRVGLQGPEYGLHPRLCVGISPAIHPESTIRAIDEGPAMIRLYFLDKWRKTLRAKKSAWPEYDFSDYERQPSFLETTRRFVAGFTEFPSLDEYFGSYTLTPEMLMGSPAPLAVLTAQDDPVIPFRYFDGLATGGSMEFYRATPHGGHCGFIEDLQLTSWAEARVLELLNARS
jgi:predicted alpha/beta-fold hydrolase